MGGMPVDITASLMATIICIVAVVWIFIRISRPGGPNPYFRAVLHTFTWSLGFAIFWFAYVFLYDLLPDDGSRTLLMVAPIVCGVLWLIVKEMVSG
jgi:hypothetical protein